MTRVLFVNVTDVSYPRHKAISTSLARAGVDAKIIRRPVNIGYVRRSLRLLFSGICSGRTDAVILGEFAVSYVWVAWIIAKAKRARLVVDGFIGMHETHIEDTEKYTSASPQAWFYRLVDYLAFRLADIYLIDTIARRDLLLRRFGRSSKPPKILVLPVGAPEWACPSPLPSFEGGCRVLYYGNYIPLHGLDKVIYGLSFLPTHFIWSATFIGPSGLAEPYKALINELGLTDKVEFLDSVPEEDLVKHLKNCHVVVGVFGDSSKARSVIANKVWQGIAAGRLVLTQNSIGLAEIRDIFPYSLLLPRDVAPDSIASILTDTQAWAVGSAQRHAARKHVDCYMSHHFNVFVSEILS
ncbi:hypothetical protein [Kocuria flava]|uniref:hypothetical protein n=1 Tax=Kocuria flava TaxID=446860 RepID=UPI002F932AF4